MLGNKTSITSKLTGVILWSVRDLERKVYSQKAQTLLCQSLRLLLQTDNRLSVWEDSVERDRCVNLGISYKLFSKITLFTKCRKTPYHHGTLTAPASPAPSFSISNHCLSRIPSLKQELAWSIGLDLWPSRNAVSRDPVRRMLCNRRLFALCGNGPTHVTIKTSVRPRNELWLYTRR